MKVCIANRCVFDQCEMATAAKMDFPDENLWLSRRMVSSDHPKSVRPIKPVVIFTD